MAKIENPTQLTQHSHMAYNIDGASSSAPSQASAVSSETLGRIHQENLPTTLLKNNFIIGNDMRELLGTSTKTGWDGDHVPEKMAEEENPDSIHLTRPSPKKS
ncbi:hypothetical protein GWK47_048232 [Chionoecetes opilio]|uniref:Uncharacterized protein n=1 Tax=Chionoecetes opilio TaxID=41210 RepID=A0A8J4Y5H6_CHIOP|nr:hypothetical protein GWK47_048232 [Chionoecetes opilio]